MSTCGRVCTQACERACVQVQVSGGSIGAGAGAGAGGSVGLGVANARSKVLTMTMSTFAGERVAAGELADIDWNEQFFLARLCSMRSLSKSALGMHPTNVQKSRDPSADSDMTRTASEGTKVPGFQSPNACLEHPSPGTCHPSSPPDSMAPSVCHCVE